MTTKEILSYILQIREGLSEINYSIRIAKDVDREHIEYHVGKQGVDPIARALWHLEKHFDEKLKAERK